jgi:outer membrane autotransporter protein
MGERLGDDIATKYDYLGGGLIVGFDVKMSERLLLGAAVGYSHTKVDMNDLDEDSKVASYQGSL